MRKEDSVAKALQQKKNTECEARCSEEHGACVNDTCMCKPGWAGEDCSVSTCNPPCAGDEVCTKEGVCEKDHIEAAVAAAKDLGSDNCPKGKNDAPCGGMGTCVGGVCFCKTGYAGSACSLRVCPGNPQCGGKGSCYLGRCVCERGFSGDKCEEASADGAEALAKEDDRAEILVLERRRNSIGEKLADVRKKLETEINSISNDEGTNDGEANSKSEEMVAANIQKLRDQALQLGEESDEITKKIDAIRAARASDADEDPSNADEAATVAAKDASAAQKRRLERMAFEIFEDDKRQEVSLALAGNKSLTDEALSVGAFADAVDAQLASMWTSIPKEYRDEYENAARAAEAVRASTWSLAKGLFRDSKDDGESEDDDDDEWVALAPATKARFFMAAQALAVGRADDAESKPKMSDAVSALQKSVHDLAFDLFCDEKFAWAERQVMSRPENAPTSRGAAFPDVQHLLAKTYKTISESQRARYKARAEQLLSSSYLVSDMPGKGSDAEEAGDIGVSSAASAAAAAGLHRTMIAFTIQFLGLKESEADRQTCGAIDESVDALLRENLQRRARVIQRADVATVNPNGSLRRRYVVSLSNANRKLVQKTIGTVKAGVQQGDLKERLASSDGIEVTPMFVMGAQPQLLSKDGHTTWTCSGERDCSFRGTCEEGTCVCRVEKVGASVQEFTGYDCSFGPSIVCPSDCSFHGACQADGTCECESGWTGKACDVETCPNACSGNGECFEGECACAPEWTGDDCSVKSERKACIDGCSGHGACSETGACECVGYYKGDECERLELPCDDECVNGGTCNNGTCACTGPWKGAACEVPTCLSGCNGNGKCVDDETPKARCECSTGWTGEACGCPSNEDGVPCSGHGMCEDGDCFCKPWWGGDRCGVRICASPDCSGHGSCGAEGKCTCHQGWKGEGCGVKVCADPTCSGHGECDGAACVCDDGWIGESCEASAKACLDDCHASEGRGECVAVPDKKQAVCICKDGYGGPGCEFKTCESACSGHGLCRLMAQHDALSGSCLCDQGWYGSDCDVWGCDPNDEDACSGNGACESEGSLRDSDDQTVHSCRCRNDWAGPRCEFEAGLEACAVCCMGETLKQCQLDVASAHETGSVMDCYTRHKSECLSRCSKGEDDKCPGNKAEYDTLLDQYRESIANTKDAESE